MGATSGEAPRGQGKFKHIIRQQTDRAAKMSWVVWQAEAETLVFAARNVPVADTPSTLQPHQQWWASAYRRRSHAQHPSMWGYVRFDHGGNTHHDWRRQPCPTGALPHLM